MTIRARCTAVLARSAMLFSGAGCGGYVLQGRAVAGTASGVAFVPADDPRLLERGIADVRISVERDPGSLGSEVVATGTSDGEGRFSIPITDFGAGWMVEQWRIRAARSGCQTSQGDLSLSGTKGLRLLVIMTPGIPDAMERENLLEQYERYR
jgi:hypothetical protein